jgi:tetratricopeptide (TPR) repeat protein
MLIFALLKIKKQPVISFGILFFMIMLAPTANLFFLNGSTVSERFLFLPSLGLIMAVVYGLASVLKINTSNFTGTGIKKINWISGGVIVLFMCLSFIRISDWESNFSIYKAGAADAPNSSRTNLSFGNQFIKLGDMETNRQAKIEYYNDALKYLKKSTDILPSNKDALYGIGLCYASMGNRAKAYESYQQALSFYPKHRSVLNNLGTAFFEEKKYDSAYFYFKRCYDADSSFPKSSQNLAIYYFTVGNYNQAIQYASNAVKLFKYQVISYDILAKAYKALGNEAEAAKYQMLYIEMKAEAEEAPQVNYNMER